MTIRTCEHTSRIVGDAVPIITLVAGTADISDVQITADPCGGYADLYEDRYDSCDDGTMTPTRYTITSLPAGHTLEIDAHERRVRILETDSGKEVSGLDPIDTLGVFRWIGSFRGCCVSIEIDPDAGTVNAATTVSVDWHDREL